MFTAGSAASAIVAHVSVSHDDTFVKALMSTDVVTLPPLIVLNVNVLPELSKNCARTLRCCVYM